MHDAQEGSFVLIPGAGGMAWYCGCFASSAQRQRVR
jgi:hypothetical protein